MRRRKSRALRQSLGLGDERIIFGIDRLDYTKGIPDRIRAFERMLKRHPEWQRAGGVLAGRGAEPRSTVALQGAQSGSRRDRRVGQQHVRYRRAGGRSSTCASIAEPDDIAAMYRAADVCVVSSLHDGMNLVAKEFIAARTDHRGVLVLSSFTGAARELHEAVLVNPFAVDEFADALHAALSMPPDQQTRRMRALHARVKSETVYDWAAGILRMASGMAETV